MTNQKEIELLPCPWCQGEAYLVTRGAWETPYYVKCKKCQCRGPEIYAKEARDDWRPIRDKAILAWNTRHDTRRELDVKSVRSYIKDVLYNEHYITGGYIDSLDVLSLTIAKAISKTFKPVVDEEKLEMIILDVQEEFERGFSKDETCIKLLQSHRRAIAKAIASHANEGRGVANN